MKPDTLTPLDHAAYLTRELAAHDGLLPRTYSPPVERVCPTCGAKIVGRCPNNYCNSRDP